MGHGTGICKTQFVHPGTIKFGRDYENNNPNFTYSVLIMASSIRAVRVSEEKHRFIYGDKPIRWPSQAVPLVFFPCIVPSLYGVICM